ncbi:HEAT repeat domain-containing protein [Microbacteriaceae bacterium VKM Ac-2854]|nr:HEAT repeat domain-containing protein [Microbacteriaceae bacterium VKM Ac-2854]
MTTSDPDRPVERPADRLRLALRTGSSSQRLQTALAAGTRPDPSYVEVLVQRCAVEPDFFVREMLTWALMRHPPAQTVPRLIYEAGAEEPLARSQALHTLSKIGDPRGWSAISAELLQDPDDDVARAAWRTASGLVPAGDEAELAEQLCRQLGRGPHETRRSLSRSIAALGESALPALAERRGHARAEVRIHALATAALIHDPDAGLDELFGDAQRADAARGPTPERGAGG